MNDLIPESEQQYGSILTIAGENAEQNSKVLKTGVEITHIAFGDANDTYVQPNRNSQALVNEIHRIEVNSVDVQQATPDSVPMLKVEAILPPELSDLVIREFATVATFNGQTFFHAIGNCARIYVPKPVNNGNVPNPVTLEMLYVITSGEAIVEIDPRVVHASREWVENRAQIKAKDAQIPRKLAEHLGDTINVKGFGADGTGSEVDDTNSLSDAINEGLNQYRRLVLSDRELGGSFPAVRKTVLVPSGVYSVSETLQLLRSNGACIAFKGTGTSTIVYEKETGPCLSMALSSPDLNLLTTKSETNNLNLIEDGRKPGTVGLLIERISNAQVRALSTFGFEIAVKIDGGIDNNLDFKGGALEGCDIAIQIQQKTGPQGGIMKPNLNQIKNVILINCKKNGIVIRNNPDESPVNRGSGGLIRIDQVNFLTNCSGPAMLIENPGETPGDGAVECGSLWFEGHGPTAISVSNGTVTVNKLFIMNGSDPIILHDRNSKIIINELEAYFNITPTDNAIIRRADGTVDGLEKQIIVRSAKIKSDGIPTVNLTKGRVVPDSALHTSQMVSDLLFSHRGNTNDIAALGNEAIFDLGTSAGYYKVAIRQADGGIVWRLEASIFYNGAGMAEINTLVFSNLALSTEGNQLTVTNTNSSYAMQLYWTVTRMM